MRGPWQLLAFSLLAAPGAAADVNVRVADGKVDLSATAATVADVLDRLSKQTGMKVVYEGAPPRQLVTVTLLARTPAEAVEDVLEGLGLNYMLIGDASGTRVQTLMMAGSAPTAPRTASAPPRPAAAPMPEADEPEEAPEEPEQPEPVIQPTNPVLPPGFPGTPPNLGGQPNTTTNPTTNGPPVFPMPPGFAGRGPNVSPFPGPSVPFGSQPPPGPVNPFAPQPTPVPNTTAPSPEEILPPP